MPYGSSLRPSAWRCCSRWRRHSCCGDLLNAQQSGGQPSFHAATERDVAKIVIGILPSHPIQYQAPWFRALAKAVDLEVFFAHRQSASEQGKAGFGVAFEWDVDLLSGYTHRFLMNVARRPGVNHFSG